MSKKSKLQARELRRKEKSGRKAANKAKYAAMAGTSANKKKKHEIGEARGIKHVHQVSNCGNIGCNKCYPHILALSKRNPNSCVFDPRF